MFTRPNAITARENYTDPPPGNNPTVCSVRELTFTPFEMFPGLAT